jgi:hypothetical protein
MVYNLRFFLFKMQFVSKILTYLVPVLFTFYIHDVLKLKKNHSGAKMLNIVLSKHLWRIAAVRPLACWHCRFESIRACKFLCWWLCVVWQRYLLGADHSSRGVLQSVACWSVIVKPWQWGRSHQLAALTPYRKEIFEGSSFLAQNFLIKSIFSRSKKLPQYFLFN